MKFEHTLCNTEFYAKPISILMHYKVCPKCSKTKRKTIEELNKNLFEIHNGEYECLGPYKNTHTKTKFIHKKCNYIFECVPSGLLNNRSSCPKCRMSQGEKIIDNYLKTNNINFIRQFSFNDCKNKRKLHYDFLCYNDNIKILIEYDGEQHYLSCYGKDKLKETKELDKIKNKYANTNKIPILRIPFWEKKIDYLRYWIL